MRPIVICHKVDPPKVIGKPGDLMSEINLDAMIKINMATFREIGLDQACGHFYQSSVNLGVWIGRQNADDSISALEELSSIIAYAKLLKETL